MDASENHSTRWWGPSTIAHNTCARWQIGPLTLWAQRLQGEWRIARESSGLATATTVERSLCEDNEDLLAHDAMSRFGVGGSNELFSLRPALADRAVVSSPQRPFYIPAGEQVTIYVGAPLWLQVQAGELLVQLDEFPIHVPSDTWFGPNPRVGELCYASRSFCRLQLEAVQMLPHRSTTAVLVQNNARSALYLERIKLPVPFLSLYCEPGGASLWTNDVVLERVEDEELAPLRVRAGAPAAVPKAVVIAGPRRHQGGGIMVRAFGSMFSDWAGEA